MDEEDSWIESRRLILSQLKTLEESIHALADKIERQNDSIRDRMVIVASEAQSAISDLRVRVAMLEVSAKIWGGVLGMLTAALTTLIIDLVVGHFVR